MTAAGKLDFLPSSVSLWSGHRAENDTPCQWPDTLVRGQLEAERIEANKVREVRTEGQDGRCSLGSCLGQKDGTIRSPASELSIEGQQNTTGWPGGMLLDNSGCLPEQSKGPHEA